MRRLFLSPVPRLAVLGLVFAVVAVGFDWLWYFWVVLVCLFGCVFFRGSYFARGMASVYALYNGSLFLFITISPPCFPRRGNKQKLIAAVACSRKALFPFVLLRSFFPFCSSDILLVVVFSVRAPISSLPVFGFSSWRDWSLRLRDIRPFSASSSFPRRTPPLFFSAMLSSFPWCPIHLLVVLMTTACSAYAPR